MKIILLKDIPKIGKRLEVKKVADGYARNYLIPKNLAVQASEKALKWAEVQVEINQKKVEEEFEKIGKLVSQVDGIEVTIPVKVGKEEQLFEKVGRQKIAEALKKMGFKVDKTQIQISKSFDQLGEFPVKIKFQHNLEAQIKVIIIPTK